MTLPLLNVPTYTLTIPSTKKLIKYRSFLVKEEKLLLIAMEEETYDALLDASKQIIANCTFGAVDVDKLTSYDLEYIILQLRIKSRGAVVDLSFRCGNQIKVENAEDRECGEIINTKVNLEQVELKEDANHTNRIMITDTIGLIMKTPAVNDLTALRKLFETEEVGVIYDFVPQFIDTIFEGEIVYTEYTPQEIKDFLESLTGDQFKKIQEFFDTLPKLKVKAHLNCIKCGHKEEIELEGLQNFLE